MMPAPLGHATGFLHGVTAPFDWCSQRVVRYFHSLMRVSRCLSSSVAPRMLGATPFVYDLLNLLEKQPADLFSAALLFFAEVPQSPKSGARMPAARH